MAIPEVSSRVEVGVRTPEAIVELRTYHWPTADFVTRCEDRCNIVLNVFHPAPEDRVCWRFEGAGKLVEVGSCGAVAADARYQVRLAPGIKRTVICSVDRPVFSRLTGVADDWFSPEFIAHLARNDALPRRMLTAMAEELVTPRFARDMAIEGYSLLLLAEIGRIAGSAGLGMVRDSAAILGRDQISRIREMVDARLHDGLTIAGLAAEMGMSRRHLGRLFKASTGSTLQDYVADARLSRVQALLLHSDLPLKAIAAQTGLSSANYLAAAFTRRMGMSPGAYRREAGGKISRH
jgi:AraC family transcriptional regulator